MRTTAIAAGLSAALTLGACAPVVQGGDPMALPPALIDSARINVIYMSSDWLRSQSDFSDTLTDEVREELNRCAAGSRPLDLRLHIDELERSGRLEALLEGSGRQTLSGLAEFTDPTQGDAVVGRYPIRVEADVGGRLAGLLGDRQMIVSEQFGRELCLRAFGRNPRAPGPHNATPG
jgi:hypothetical protein